MLVCVVFSLNPLDSRAFLNIECLPCLYLSHGEEHKGKLIFSYNSASRFFVFALKYLEQPELVGFGEIEVLRITKNKISDRFG